MIAHVDILLWPHSRNHREAGSGFVSDQNPLDLIQADGIMRAVIQLGRARRLVIRYLLSVFNCTTILQVGGNAGSPKRMAAGRLGQVTRPVVCPAVIGRHRPCRVPERLATYLRGIGALKIPVCWFGAGVGGFRCKKT